MDIKSPHLIICLIDDDLIYQFTIKRITELVNPLQKLIIFSNGKEAIDFLHQHSDDPAVLPDLIFLDINMPVMNGWEFLEAFKQTQSPLIKKIPIYMVSSSLDENDKNRSLGFTSVTDFIVKPLDKKVMQEILKSYSLLK